MVAFAGDGGGTGELTWSQANLWQGMTVDGPPITLGGAIGTGTDYTVEKMAELLRFVVSRNQALRTRLVLRGDRPPLQVCVPSGEVPLAVVDAGTRDPVELAERIAAEYRKKPFDYEAEFPVRMAVVHRDGVALWMVAVFLHLALDQSGIDAMMADVRARDPETGAPAGPVTAPQPLELATKQAGTHAQRKSAAAMAYLEHVLRAMPVRQFGAARFPDTGMRVLRMRSPATALAIRRTAMRAGTTTSSAVLAAFAVGVARFTGHPTVMAMLLVNNRFRPGLADVVSPVVQMSPCLVDIAGATLDEVVARTGTSVLTAYKHAYYDPYQQDAVFDRIEAERGPLEYWNYNDHRDRDRSLPPGPPPTDDEIATAVADRELVWEPGAPVDKGAFFLDVVDGPDSSLVLVLNVPVKYVSEGDMVALLTEIEAAAVRTAVDPGAPTDFSARPPKSGGGRPQREVIHHA